MDGGHMPLVRPQFAREVLGNPPIVLAIAQVQFDSVLGIADPKTVAPFQDTVRSRYPKSSRVSSLEITVTPSGVEGKPSESSSWSFENETGEWKVLLDTNSVSLEVREYTRFEDMRDQFLWIVES